MLLNAVHVHVEKEAISDVFPLEVAHPTYCFNHEAHNAPADQILTKSGSARLNYSGFNKYVPPVLQRGRGWRRGHFVFPKFSGSNCIKFEEDIGHSLALPANILHFRYVASFQNQRCLKGEGRKLRQKYLLTPCKNQGSNGWNVWVNFSCQT